MYEKTGYRYVKDGGKFNGAMNGLPMLRTKQGSRCSILEDFNHLLEASLGVVDAAR